MKEVIYALAHSRKVLIAVWIVAQTLLLDYAGVSYNIILILDTALSVLIGAIAFEDAGGKLGDSVANSLMLLNRVLQEKAKEAKRDNEQH